MKNKFSKVTNLFYLPSPNIRSSSINKPNTSILSKQHGGSTDPSLNLNMSIVPTNKSRLVLDVEVWREALALMENQMIPQRYLVQICYLDTVLDPQVKSCLELRESLTLLKKFKLCNENGTENKKWTEYFNKPWFKKWSKYVLGAKWYGYSLISMGPIENGEYNKIVMIPRTNISPDRRCVQPVANSLTGPSWDDEPYKESHIYIEVPDEHGLTSCGYGLLYEVTLLAIGLRNNLNFNSQFVEVFGMPYRYVKTDNLDKVNIDRLQAMLENMGSLGYGIIRKDEELEFVDAGGKGQGYKSYADLEVRLDKAISKIILGHADAMDSTKGALGGQQGDESPQAQAINRVNSSDCEFMMEQINTKLLPFMRENGVPIPSFLHFEYQNDLEEKVIEKYRNEQNFQISQTIKNLYDSGIEVNPDSIKELMEMELTKKPPMTPQPSSFQPQKTINAADPEKFEKFKERLDDKKRPSSIEDPGEWQEYKTDLEYKYLTKGFDEEKQGLTKEEYDEYAADIQEYLDTDTPLDREDGEDGNIHPYCECQIVDNIWTFGENPCDDCISAADDYNNAKGEVGNSLSIFNKHMQR